MAKNIYQRALDELPKFEAPLFTKVKAFIHVCWPAAIVESKSGKWFVTYNRKTAELPRKLIFFSFNNGEPDWVTYFIIKKMKEVGARMRHG